MSDLNLQQLKDYLKCVFELEGALYKHNKLVEGYSSYRNAHKPPEPLQKSATTQALPSKNIPIEPDENGWMIWLGACGYIACCIGAFLAMAEVGAGFVLLIFGGIGAFLSEKHKKQRTEEHKDKISLWEKECEKVRKQNELEQQRVTQINNEKLRHYQTHELLDYNNSTNTQLKEFEKVRNQLQASLSKLYSQNIIYSKYRNLVAIATIYEYFDSGRCTELEGPNGAYNMYESELRSNIIICSLSQIISDLGQIKNGQYALYEQIRLSNENVTHLLNNIYNAQTLTAYYAEAAAIAASADRITYGVVF